MNEVENSEYLNLGVNRFEAKKEYLSIIAEPRRTKYLWCRSDSATLVSALLVDCCLQHQHLYYLVEISQLILLKETFPSGYVIARNKVTEMKLSACIIHQPRSLCPSYTDYSQFTLSKSFKILSRDVSHIPQLKESL